MAEIDTDVRAAHHVKLAIGLWLTILVLSLAIPFFITPTGSSFTRGLNRLEPSLWLQLFGFVVAVWSARTSLRSSANLPKPLRVLGLVPLGLFLVAGILLIVLVAID